MSAVCLDLEQTLSRLDPPAAAALEQLVQESLILAKTRNAGTAPMPAVDARGLL